MVSELPRYLAHPIHGAMSPDGGAPLLAKSLFINNAMHLTSMAILVYDHIITLAIEVEYVWLRPKNRASHVFFVFRYTALIVTVLATVLGLWTAPLKVRETTCSLHRPLTHISRHAERYATFVLIMQRVYAIFGKSRRVLYGLLLYAAVGSAVILWAISTQKYDMSPGDEALEPGTGLRCPVTVSGVNSNHLSAIWITVMVYDFIVFAMTTYKTFGALREPHMPIMQLLLRDGAIYFGSMFALNFVNVLTYYVRSPSLQGFLVPVVSCVSVAILSRMMLHLQETSANRSKQTTGGVELTTLPWVVAHSTVVLDSLVCSDPSSTSEVERRATVEAEGLCTTEAGRRCTTEAERRCTAHAGRRDTAEVAKAGGLTEIV
ncbi:uncharacterized protein SCHCODRAFT_02519948 [Schizophyllum commune H4-8]|uniref:uncharacterized protein n=1 Tax=Schizophyllum commune (strain H4-8 / FGSC 9210) TaxID=578458 RepID=UPI0021606A58|nr:uncharacterized protein SCHCODRAFT_02519948 [Schizophyllum commune H4-8]KAI5885673.1 hypothetical protein SCHCODRAFT_02519948 [Schizophyllum commune H4-8]